MAKKTEQKDERRRFKPEKRDAWTEEQRAEYVEKREKLRPFIEDLTTKVPEKKKGFFDIDI